VSVVLFIAAIVSAALGVWWLAAMTFTAGLMLAAIYVYDETNRTHRRQLDDLDDQ